MTYVAIIDYGMCNLDSMARAVEECGGHPQIIDNPVELREATHIILPGVGAFPDAMRNLKEKSFDRALEEQVIGKDIPFLGVCLGMQLLAAVGREGADTPGLGWIDGEVKRLVPTGADTHIPHIGWNEVYPEKESPLFAGIAPGRDFYFVHSYHLVVNSPEEIIARTPYADGFVSAVNRDHIYGVQFHPEKSQKAGFQVLKNFLSL